MDKENRDTNNAVKLPTFSGKKKDFHTWWVQFCAYCTMKKIHEAQDKAFILPADPKVPEGDNDVAKKLSKRCVAQNAAVVACLTVASITSDLIEFCTESATKNYPGGIAKVIVEKLYDKHFPANVVAGVEAELDFSLLKFKPGCDLDEFFTRLLVLRSKYKKSKKFEEDVLIARTVAKAPPMYIGDLLSEMQVKGCRLTLKDIQDTMKSIYHLYNNKYQTATTYPNPQEQEVTLPAFDKFTHKPNRFEKRTFKKENSPHGSRYTFSGKCRTCRNIRH